MCCLYIVLMSVSSKSDVQSLARIHFGVRRSSNNSNSSSISTGDTSTSRLAYGEPRRALRMTNPPEDSIRYPASNIKQLASIFSAKGGFRFAQHHPLTILLFPGIWFLLTSLWSSYPEVSASRSLYFILISTGCMSAGILWLHYSGKGILDFLLPANIFVILLCLFSIVTNIPSDSWTGGHGKGFVGFFGHQNLLASVLLFTMPAVFSKLWLAVNSKQLLVYSNEIKLKSLLTSHYLLLTAYCLLLTANLLLLALTYSRSAILSFLLGVIVFLILTKSWKIISYSFIALALITLIIYITPSLNQFADKIIKKDFPEFYSSRMWMWEPSYRAAVEGGFIGLGYGISHPDIRSGEYSDRFENGRLIREKGNSSLALIEEAGLIGLALFLLPLIVMIANYNKVPPTPHSLLSTSYFLLAAIYAFLLHSQFEAWWIGVGSVQLPLFFIYFGLIVHSSTFNSSMFKA